MMTSLSKSNAGPVETSHAAFWSQNRGAELTHSHCQALPITYPIQSRDLELHSRNSSGGLGEAESPLVCLLNEPAWLAGWLACWLAGWLAGRPAGRPAGWSAG